jgi:hypothetical protein
VEEGHIFTPHDSTQGQAEERFTAHQLLLYSTVSTSVLIMGRMGLAVHQTPFPRTRITLKLYFPDMFAVSKMIKHYRKYIHNKKLVHHYYLWSGLSGG